MEPGGRVYAPSLIEAAGLVSRRETVVVREAIKLAALERRRFCARQNS